MKSTRKLTLYTTRGALIAALYVIMTLVSSLVGLASGVIQFRISEALCILPIFFPEAVPGLFVGCLLSNLLAGGVVWDVIFGSIATLIGAYGAYLLRGLPQDKIWVATLPTILSNMIIVPFVLIFAYGAPDSYFFLAITVGIGEIVCAGVLGSGLYYLLKKTKIKWLK
ncbi:MAG: QueT transporter family protein [Clostridia bacterium]|nr:QueT transporter family protein [Clostridia bacterium]